MRGAFLKTMLAGIAAVTMSAAVANAGPLTDRIAAGEPIRIGFANEIPFAYPGEDGSPKGFVNVYTLGVLKAMGYDNIEFTEFAEPPISTMNYAVDVVSRTAVDRLMRLITAGNEPPEPRITLIDPELVVRGST